MPEPVTLEKLVDDLLATNEKVPSVLKMALTTVRLAGDMHDSLNSGIGVAMLAGARDNLAAVSLVMNHLTAKLDALATEWS